MRTSSKEDYVTTCGQNITFALQGQRYGNSLCLLLMFRGLNDVLQDPNTAGDHPFFLMTLWFNPSLFTIQRKMFQSPLDL